MTRCPDLRRGGGGRERNPARAAAARTNASRARAIGPCPERPGCAILVA